MNEPICMKGREVAILISYSFWVTDENTFPTFNLTATQHAPNNSIFMLLFFFLISSSTAMMITSRALCLDLGNAFTKMLMCRDGKGNWQKILPPLCPKEGKTKMVQLPFLPIHSLSFVLRWEAMPLGICLIIQRARSHKSLKTTSSS